MTGKKLKKIPGKCKSAARRTIGVRRPREEPLFFNSPERDTWGFKTTTYYRYIPGSSSFSPVDSTLQRARSPGSPHVASPVLVNPVPAAQPPEMNPMPLEPEPNPLPQVPEMTESEVEDYNARVIVDYIPFGDTYVSFHGAGTESNPIVIDDD